MVWTIHYEITLAEMYHFLSGITLTVAIVLGFVLFFVYMKFNEKIFDFISWSNKKFRRTIYSVVTILFVVCVLLVFYFNMMSNVIDEVTSVRVDEKIVIIELDDYWNFNDSELYFQPYGYNFERYRNVSDVLIENGFVGTVGVTPYIFEEKTYQNFALRDDSEMISYLEELQEEGFEVGMHGYNHCRNSYYCPRYEEVWYNIEGGKREIEGLFGERVFSYFPPGNEWTTEQYENVKKAGFVIIGNTHVPKAYFDDDVIITQRGYDPIYYYGWYEKDFRHTSVDEWIDAYEDSNLFILQLHANTFDSKEKIDDLDAFLKYAKEDGAKSMTYKDFYNYMMDKKDGTNKITGKVFLETD